MPDSKIRSKEFVIYCGSMFSGKTTLLSASVERHRFKKSKIACFKSHLDGRYSDTSIVTHSGAKISAIPISNGSQLLSHLEEDFPDVIAVDEAFMIDGCSQALVECFRRGASIYVSSIELSANLKPFSEIEKMMPYATKIVKCKAVCVYCGEDASLTHRKIHSFEEISVGGSDSYEPVCWECHPNTKEEISI